MGKRYVMTLWGMLFCVLVLTTGNPARAAVAMPDFALSGVIDGNTVSSKDFKGKGLLVVFFATWCGPCRQEIPSLIKLQNEFGPRGFSVIGLSVDEDGPGVVAKLVKKMSINYPVLMADRATASDFGGISGIPTAFLVNRKGHVVKKYSGFVPHAILARDVKEIMQ